MMLVVRFNLAYLAGVIDALSTVACHKKDAPRTSQIFLMLALCASAAPTKAQKTDSEATP